MGKITLILTLFFSLSSYALEVGDILLQPLKCWSCTLIEQQERSDYAHMGIYIGEKQVAEAFFDSVKIVSLEKFMQKTDPDRRVRVRRLKKHPKSLVPKLLSGLQEFLDRPYDRWFVWDDEKIYCSELVYKLLKKFVAFEDLAPKPMLFDQNPEYWDRYFRGQTPRGQLGISPEDFNLSSDFETVEELDYVPTQKN